MRELVPAGKQRLHHSHTKIFGNIHSITWHNQQHHNHQSNEPSDEIGDLQFRIVQCGRRAGINHSQLLSINHSTLRKIVAE